MKIVSAASFVLPDYRFDVTLALYAVNACARIPEMALRVTASIVGLTTSRDEKSSPALLDMVARKCMFCSYATGSRVVQRQCEEESAKGLSVCFEENTDVTLLLVPKTPATAVLAYLGSTKTAFRHLVEYHQLGIPP